MTTSIIRDRDDMPIQVGREVDVHGTVAADSPDVVLRLGNPANHGAEAYLTPGQARALAHALLTATQDHTGLVSPLATIPDLYHALDHAVHHDPDTATRPVYAYDPIHGIYHEIATVDTDSGDGQWVVLELQETHQPDDHHETTRR